jgi:hypothetical protein
MSDHATMAQAAAVAFEFLSAGPAVSFIAVVAAAVKIEAIIVVHISSPPLFANIYYGNQLCFVHGITENAG